MSACGTWPQLFSRSWGCFFVHSNVSDEADLRQISVEGASIRRPSKESIGVNAHKSDCVEKIGKDVSASVRRKGYPCSLNPPVTFNWLNPQEMSLSCPGPRLAFCSQQLLASIIKKEFELGNFITRPGVQSSVEEPLRRRGRSMRATDRFNLN
jgi:hypothetical protein